MAGSKKPIKKEKDTEKEDPEKRPAEPPGEKLVVAVRVRPLKSEEAEKGSYNITSVLGTDKVELREPETGKDDHLRKNRLKDKVFQYDKAFGQDSTQDEVYRGTARPLVEDVLQGFNATVFAYGATGAGKTFTMVGGENNLGIMVRSLNDIFKAMKDNRNPKLDFKISMSYLEIYNENIRDLLEPSKGTLELREDAKTGVIQVAGLSKTSTTSTEEVLQLLTKGNKIRICESTSANKTSSRSHALLQVTVAQTLQGGEKAKVKVGKLYMIDLAGSERAKQTQNQGKLLKEGAFINRSLLALGNCINALAEGKAKYVNFRDSKLTRLLKDALSGNCRTVMIAHVSPSHRHREETRNTLIYADKAKNISNKTRRNVLDVSYHVSQYQTIITELKEEINRLNSKLSTDLDPQKGVTRNSAKTKELKKTLIETFREQMNLRNKLMEIDNNVLSLSMEFERQNQVVQEWESERLRRSKKPNHTRNSRGEITLDMDNDRDRDDDFDDDEDEPDEVSQAWEDLVYLQKEQQRYTEMREKVEQEMIACKTKGQELEEELPNAINSEDQRELLSLLCKVHELEIQKMEMESEAVLKEHELQRRDLLILRYDRQRSLCEEIITRQRQMLEADRNPMMPPELQELYSLYQQELQYTNVERDTRYLNELNSIYRSPSMLSLRSNSTERLPPIAHSNGSGKEPEKLFRARRHSLGSIQRSSSPTLSLMSPASSAGSYRGGDTLPPINRNRSNSLIGVDGQPISPKLFNWPGDPSSSSGSRPRSTIPTLRPTYRDYYPHLARSHAPTLPNTPGSLSGSRSAAPARPPSLPGSSPISRYPTLPPIRAVHGSTNAAHYSSSQQKDFLREHQSSPHLRDALPGQPRVPAIARSHRASHSDDEVASTVKGGHSASSPRRSRSKERKKIGPRSGSDPTLTRHTNTSSKGSNKTSDNKKPVIQAKKTPRRNSLPRVLKGSTGVAGIAGRGVKKPSSNTPPALNSRGKTNKNEDLRKDALSRRRRSKSQDPFNYVGLGMKY